MGRNEKSSSSSSRPRKRSPDDAGLTGRGSSSKQPPDDADPDDEDSKRAEVIQNGLNEAVQNKEGGSSRKRSPDDADLEGADTEDDDQEDADTEDDDQEDADTEDDDTEDDDTEDDEAVPNTVAERMERMSNSDGMLCNTCRTEAEALEANLTRMVDLKTKLKEMKRHLRELKRLARSDLVKRRQIFAETICGNPGNLSVDLHTDMDAIGAVLTCAVSINKKKYRQNLKNWWTERAQYADTKKELKDLRSQRPLLTRQLVDTLGILYYCDAELFEVFHESL